MCLSREGCLTQGMRDLQTHDCCGQQVWIPDSNNERYRSQDSRLAQVLRLAAVVQAHKPHGLVLLSDPGRTVRRVGGRGAPVGSSFDRSPRLTS